MILPFEVSRAEVPIEVRTVLPHGAIEGQFRLLEIFIESDLQPSGSAAA